MPGYTMLGPSRRLTVPAPVYLPTHIAAACSDGSVLTTGIPGAPAPAYGVRPTSTGLALQGMTSLAGSNLWLVESLAGVGLSAVYNASVSSTTQGAFSLACRVGYVIAGLQLRVLDASALSNINIYCAPGTSAQSRACVVQDTRYL